jgi:hypothetical protein
MPESRANIDHIAIAPSGVLVIDTKRPKGKIEARKQIFGEEALGRRSRQDQAPRPDRTGRSAD